MELHGINKHIILPFDKNTRSWNRRFLRWFGTLPKTRGWCKRAITTLKEAYGGKTPQYDIVLSFMTSAQFNPLVAGLRLARHYGSKYGIYSVDALPPPGGWTKAKDLRGKTIAVKKHYCHADYVAAANKHMLAYQLTIFTPKANLVTSTLLTSSPQESYSYPISSENVLLYTGTLYGLRNPRYLFTAFKRILESRGDATLILIGNKLHINCIDEILTPEQQKHVVVMPYADDLTSLYARAKVLIDIDADRDKDPFLSSKIATYIKVNRMIVCETGSDTPSREMFGGLRTIIQCNHSTDSLYDGLIRALDMADTEQDYSERVKLIEMFDIESIGRIFYQDLQTVCKKR